MKPELVEQHLLFAGRHVVAKEAITAVTPVDEQESRAVGPPVGDEYRTLDVELQIFALPGGEVPDRGPLVAGALVLDGEQLGSRSRRPTAGFEGHALIDLLPDRRPGTRIEHAQGRMDEVAVLRVFEAKECPIGREASEQEAGLAGAADSNRLLRPVDLPRRVTVQRDVDTEPRAVADAGSDDAGSLRQPLAPAVRSAIEERFRLAARERLDDPAPCFGSRLVLEPEHPFAVQCRRAVDDPDRLVGDLTAITRRDVPRVELPDAGLVRRVDRPLRCPRRPLRQKGNRRAEAPLPVGQVGHGGRR